MNEIEVCVKVKGYSVDNFDNSHKEFVFSFNILMYECLPCNQVIFNSKHHFQITEFRKLSLRLVGVRLVTSTASNILGQDEIMLSLE